MRVLVVVLAAAACGGGEPRIMDDAGAEPDGVIAIDSPVEPGWTTLIERSWQLGPTVEGFKCMRLKVVEDTYINAFRVQSPPGTHHELLTISQTTGPLGAYDCDAGNTDLQMLYAGGIATDDLVFPDGVAIKLSANSFINLNLHVANFTDDPISGTSGIQIKTLAPSEVVHEAEAVFLGTFDIHIQPMTTNALEQGSCAIPEPWNLVNLWPHMHGYAKHQRVTLRRNSTGTIDTLLDANYSYTDQKNYPMPNVQLNTNDELRVDCLYDNATKFEVLYGDSATQEMCFAGFYKYPANGIGKYFCAQL